MKNMYYAAVILLTVTSFTGCRSQKESSSQAKETSHNTQAVLHVKAVQVQTNPGTYTVEFPGVVRADTESLLSFRVSGVITSMPAKVGLHVEKGEVIAQVDCTIYENAKARAMASMERAKAREKDLVAEFHREHELWTQQISSKEKMQSARAAADRARDELKIAENNLAEATRHVTYATLKAPYEGIIAQKRCHTYQYIESGQPVVLLLAPTNMLFTVQLPSSMVQHTDRFQEYQCVFPFLNELSVPAYLHGIGPSALPPIHTVPLTVALQTTTNFPVLPGTEGILRITMRDRHKVSSGECNHMNE